MAKIFSLPNYTSIIVKGPDSEKFLQGQISCDLTKQKEYFDNCIELTSQNLNTLTEHVNKKRIFLMCGNKTFNGLQEQLLKNLLDTNI